MEQVQGIDYNFLMEGNSFQLDHGGFEMYQPNLNTYENCHLHEDSNTVKPSPTIALFQVSDNSQTYGLSHTKSKIKRQRKQQFGGSGTLKSTGYLYELDDKDGNIPRDLKKKIAKAKKSKEFRLGKKNLETEMARKLAICVKMLLERGATLQEIDEAWTSNDSQ